MNSGCRNATNPINNNMSGRENAEKNGKSTKRKKASFFFVFVTIVWGGIALVELASVIIGALGAWVNPTQYIKTE